MSVYVLEKNFQTTFCLVILYCRKKTKHLSVAIKYLKGDC